MAKKTVSRTTKKSVAARPSTKIDDRDDGDELDAILAESERENETLINVLEQAQRAQKSLSAAQKRIKDLETRHEAAHRRETTALADERDAARESAQATEAAHKALASAMQDAAKTARTLATALVKLGDPLAPLTDEDSSKELDALRDAVKELASAKGDEANVGATLGQARELAEMLSGRVSQQSNRVKLLRKHLSAMEGDVERATSEADALRKTISSKDGLLTTHTKELSSARTTITGLEKELSSTASKLDKHTRSSLDAEAKALRDHDRLTKEHHTAELRADELAKDITALRTQVQQAERLAADLGQLLADTCDDMCGVEGVDGPSSELAKRELLDLVNTLSDAADDDLEAAFREDVCDDLLPTGRALATILAKRHKSLGAALASSRKREDQAAAKITKISDQLDSEKTSHKDAKQEVTRQNAQLKAAAKEAERLSRDLQEHISELGETKGEVARLSSENDSLGKLTEAGKLTKAELVQCRADLTEAQTIIVSKKAESETWSVGLKQLARALVELAAATESALVAAGLKPEGFIGRFTRSMRKLENDVGTDGDIAALLKSSLDMAEKAASRIGQLERELRMRSEQLQAAERDRDANAKELASTSKERDDKHQRLVIAEAELDVLGKEAKRAKELDVTFAKTSGELATASAALASTTTDYKLTKAELEELRAREAATSESLGRELESLRKRVAEAQQAQRDQETSNADIRDELDAKVAAMTARAGELEKALESREARITALTKDVGSAAEKAARASDDKKKADQLKARLSKADERIKSLESDLEDALHAADAADEVEALRSERDDLAARLRAAEKRAAEASGAAARATSTAESLKKKIDDRQTGHRSELDATQERCDTLTEENRRLKEKLAGLNARVRTLTDLG